MARGGRRGGRGGGRGKGGGDYRPAGDAKDSGLGIPGAQNNKTSFAQSAGKVNTFQGTSGGGAFGNKSGGSKGTKRIGTGKLSNNTSYTLRSPGGDQTTVRGGLPGARVGPNLAAAKGTKRDAMILPHLRKGAQRGRGGSTQ
jgi:hypothetical protein